MTPFAENRNKEGTLAISVVIPAYNAAKHIARALDSVRQQSRPPDQIVIVDDGSSDNTIAVVEQWARQHALSVDVYSKKNGGAASARNVAFGHANGDLIALLDADDWMYPHHLETLALPFFQERDVVLSFGNVEVRRSDSHEFIQEFPGDKIELVTSKPYSSPFEILTGPIFSSLIGGSYIGVSATLFARHAGEAVNWMDEELYTSEDRDFFLKLSRKGLFAYTDRTVALKYEHGDNTTHPRHALRTAIGAVSVLEKMMSQVEELNLSSAEVQSTRDELERAIKDLHFQASCRGIQEYVSTLYRFRHHGFPRLFSLAKGLVRATGASTGLQSRDES